ncbi:MAG: hypothetical protein IPN29_09350 [Saprospiraceae bacterium]|nr:hypothetical protein [Saprospiraceae bacterium]
MESPQEQLETLKEIRSLMERSSRFLSLSGLTGVIAGITAIGGVAVAYLYLGLSLTEPAYYRLAQLPDGSPNQGFYTFLLADLVVVFLISLFSALVLTRQKAQKDGHTIWDAPAKRLTVNLAIPLVTGALFCAILLYHGELAFIAPSSLLFYGMALLNAGKYTLEDVRFLGMAQIVTGLICSVYPEYGLLFWAFGFGLLHIFYGVAMYYKYEK